MSDGKGRTFDAPPSAHEESVPSGRLFVRTPQTEGTLHAAGMVSVKTATRQQDWGHTPKPQNSELRTQHPPRKLQPPPLAQVVQHIRFHTRQRHACQEQKAEKPRQKQGLSSFCDLPHKLHPDGATPLPTARADRQRQTRGQPHADQVHLSTMAFFGMGSPGCQSGTQKDPP